MYEVRPNLLTRKIYPSALWRVLAKEKLIFLTFDDGPSPDITPWVLTELKKLNAKATFFCIGENIEKHPELFKKIINEGHAVGNHTYSHLNGWKTKTKDYLENVEKCNIRIKSQIPRPKTQDPKSEPQVQKLFRPPYGKLKPSHYSLLTAHYSLIMWDVLSGDFDRKISEEKCLKNVISKTRPGSIVVFHDNTEAKKNLFYVLPKFLEYFTDKKFVFSLLPFS